MKNVAKTNKIIVPVKEFSTMTSSEIVKLMESNKAFAIIGGVVGVDRHIIERENY